ncbi:unnamed protein product [Symbiodinium sp. CCMP2592]|nr:unnamed protein product [Symbiodinium sp. CCMP2592]
MLQTECQALAVDTMREKHWKRSPADGAFPSLCIGVVRWHVDNRSLFLAAAPKGLADFCTSIDGEELQNEVEADHNLVSHHTEPRSTRDLVAIMVVGQSRRMLEDIERTRLAFELSPRIRQHLRSRNVSTSFKSHVLHALEPLRRAGLVPEYLLCIDMGSIEKSQLPPEVVQSWTFRADSQVKRITTCLRRVLERESKKNISYSFFVRLRPDFLLLSDLPDPRDPRRGPGCMLTRLRSAVNIRGLTNEHLSFCYCQKHCCSEVLHGDAPGYIVDDMLALSARDLFLLLWLGNTTRAGPPKLWPRFITPMAETDFTTSLLQKGIPVCPLAVRGLPLGSFGSVHATEASRCGYLEDAPALAQTACGQNLTEVEDVPLLTPLALP